MDVDTGLVTSQVGGARGAGCGLAVGGGFGGDKGMIASSGAREGAGE